MAISVLFLSKLEGQILVHVGLVFSFVEIVAVRNVVYLVISTLVSTEVDVADIGAFAVR